MAPLDAHPASLTASRMRRLLDADDDRASVLAFVAHLEEDDEQLLAGLIDERTHSANGQAGARSAGYALRAPTV